MKIAVPVADGKLCMHFGHCEQFTIFDVDQADKQVKGQKSVTPPPHEPGVLPKFLAEKGVNLVIAGGMGSRAVNLFKERGVNVITGAPAGNPLSVVESYLNGTLITGANTCDH
jgi:predicted Fe-Mo cluster-binding NifX family protein